MSRKRSGGPSRDEEVRPVSLVPQGSTTISDVDAQVAEILSIAAHELRTPATVILGLAATLAANRERMSEDQVHEAILRVDRQANRLVGLLEDLLDLSRIQRGELDVTLDSIELSEAISSAISVARAPDGARVNIAVPVGVAVLAEAPGLERILVNLLTNAYRYGGPNVRVEARHVPGGVRVSVVDDGPGVPAELVPHLFKPFRAEVGGTGLGLSIVRGLAEAYGGTASYQGEATSGARFDVTLRAGSSETGSEEESRYASDPRVPLNILIVDDEPDVLFLLRLTLETAGYAVAEAAHGAEALAAIRVTRPSLLVTDLMMPVMDGRELIRKVRATPETADLPIMLLSANPDSSSGADRVMRKPFNPRDLTRAIDELVGRNEG
jgi:CheY-like chemotaxis protein